MARWGLAAVAAPLIAVGDYVTGTGHGDPWPRRNVGATIAGTGAALPGGTVLASTAGPGSGWAQE